MNLFVDANIFLDFYHFSNDDLEELEKLVDLINKREITLVITSQIIDEIKRNRDNKVADAYKKFKDSKIKIDIPQICKAYSEYEQIRNLLKTLEKLITDLEDKLNKDINERTLKADKLISKLLSIAKQIDSEKYLEVAKKRYDLGNPPGKNDSYGDCLNWLALLNELEDGEDLFFISDDKDYKSPLGESILNSFLVDEWKQKKGADIFFYTKLSSFFNDHHDDIQLRVEEEKNKLIEALSDSYSFAHTHTLISKLGKYVSYTDEQIRELSNIGAENSQVNLILGDPDVKEFYTKLLENKKNIISPDVAEAITKRLEENEENAEDTFKEIPF
jgi:predicted nucleic acid-binding protein